MDAPCDGLLGWRGSPMDFGLNSILLSPNVCVKRATVLWTFSLSEAKKLAFTLMHQMFACLFPQLIVVDRGRKSWVARNHKNKLHYYLGRKAPSLKMGSVRFSYYYSGRNDYHTLVSYFWVFQMSTISRVSALQLWNLAVFLILTRSFSWWGSFLWLMKFNLC